MEFILASARLSGISTSRNALVHYLLNKLDQIDEKEISDSRLAQEVFLCKHQKELSKRVEKRLVPKVLEDIDFILKEGCAQEISKFDFNHVHLCKVSQDPIFKVKTLLSDDNVRLLYHTCEERYFMPYFAKRNIKSSLVSNPEIITLDYEEFVDTHGIKTYRFMKTTVYSTDLGWSEFGKMKFEKCPDGLYSLKNGTKLKMIGMLDDYLAYHIKIKNGAIEFNGKTIGRIKS
jgi:hypothetical protein